MHVEVRHWELRPDEIIRKRFSSRLRGADRREVREVLCDMAAALDRSREHLALNLLEETVLKRALRECETTIGALERQLATANEQLQAYQEAAKVLRETRTLAEQARHAAERVFQMRLKGIQMEAAWMTERYRTQCEDWCRAGVSVEAHADDLGGGAGCVTPLRLSGRQYGARSGA